MSRLVSFETICIIASLNFESGALQWRLIRGVQKSPRTVRKLPRNLNVCGGYCAASFRVLLCFEYFMCLLGIDINLRALWSLGLGGGFRLLASRKFEDEIPGEIP